MPECDDCKSGGFIEANQPIDSRAMSKTGSAFYRREKMAAQSLPTSTEPPLAMPNSTSSREWASDVTRRPLGVAP